MLKFKGFIEEAKKLSPKQKKIAALAGDENKLDADDFAALRNGAKIKEEAEHLEEATYEIDVAHGDSTTKGEPLDNVKKHAAKYNLKVKHISDNGPAGGAHVVHLKGKKEDAHKFISKHYDDSADHDDIEDMYRVKKSVKEEVEAIDETSKDLALRYLDKAPRSARIHGQLASEFKKTAERKRNPGLKAALEKSGQKYQRKAWNREDGIKRAIKKVANEEVEIEEGKIHGMGAIYTSMMHHADTKGYSSHKQFTPADYDTVGKQHGISGQELAVLAGHKTAHQASTQFKKPVQKGHEMDRAKALAQRGMQSLSKEEVEAIEEKLAHMHEPSRPHIYVKPNHEPSRPNIHVKPNHEPQDDIERFSKPRPKGGYGPSPINRKYKPTEYNYAYKEEVEQIDEAIPKTGWKVNKQLTANMDAPKHKDNKAYTTSASAQHSAFIHRSHDDDKWHVQIGTSDGKNHYKAFDSYEKAKAHLHSKTGITEELENESFKPEVEKSFPASGVKTGSSAPKGTSTMPKDKNKAKGQPAGSIGEEMSPYVKATLAVMDEGKMDDYQDMLRAKKATASAYDKNFKPDTSHPHIQVVKGTQYGGQNQKDDEGDEKKPDDETKEKRGRGRPHGSKSGARQKGNGHEDGGIPVHNLHLPNRNK